MWPELLQGAVHAANDFLGTCRTTGGPRNYDFFIVDKRISSAVERLWVDRQTDMWPHWPVHMVMSLAYRSYTKLIARTPKNIDIDLPIGCAPKPSQWPAIPKELTSAEHSTEIWSALSRSAEEEARDIWGIVGRRSGHTAGDSASPNSSQCQFFQYVCATSQKHRRAHVRGDGYIGPCRISRLLVVI